MTVVARRPLMLKEYLELDDDDSDRIAASGLAGATTVRCLLDAELRCGGESPVPKERPGKKALTKFSAAINAVKLLPFSPAPEGSLPRCFSERLKGSFWGKKRCKKQKKNKGATTAAAAGAAEQQSGEGWRSLRFPSPVASSRSSWSETECSSGSDFLPASMASSESPHRSKTAAGGEESDGEAVDSGTAKESESKVVEEAAERRSSAEEEKEQLSPVSVIDYPFQQSHGDDDENNTDEVERTNAASPAFYRSLGSIERTKEQLMNRIRRFEMLAASELEPADLEECSPSLEATDHVATSDEEEEVKAWDLLGELKSRPRGSTEKLLLNFFKQGQSRACDAHRLAGAGAAEMLRTARDWIDWRRCGEVDDDCGEAALREMERNGRWRCFYEEEEDLAVYVEVLLLEWLLEEAVQDLTLC